MTTPAETRRIKPFVKLPPGDKPYLAGLVCKACEEVLLGGAPRLTCPKCAARAGCYEIKLAETGSLFVFTTAGLVHYENIER